MFKNRAIKKLLKKTIFPVLTFVNRIVVKKENYILLYSANDGIRHNLRPLMEYLLENNYDSKYKIICGIENLKFADDNTRVIYVDRLRSIICFLKSKYIFYTTGQIPIKPSKKQMVIHLDHGAANFKACGALSQIGNGYEFYFTYYMAPSEVYRKIVAKEFGCDEENILINGEPVTDIFYKESEVFPLGTYKKIGLWVPTFRQSEGLGYNDSGEELLPMFCPKQYEELNEKLQKLDIKLIVKMHAGQNVEGLIKNQVFSHLELLSDTDFTKKGYSLYPLLKQINFMIADYSSVFLQFLLLDKPIGFVVPDFEEYAQKRGFVFEKPLDYMPGDIIRNKAQLYQFLNDMAEEKDDYMRERHKVRDIIHTYQDGNNTRRVLEMSGIMLE